MRIIISLGAAVMAVALISFAIWIWQDAPERLVEWDAARPLAMLWAIRSGAVALAALAQVLVVVLAIGKLYSRRRLDDVLRLGFSAMAVLAMVSAVALGLAAR